MGANEEQRILSKIFGPGGMHALEMGLVRYIKELKRQIEIFRATGENDRANEVEELLKETEEALEKVK